MRALIASLVLGAALLVGGNAHAQQTAPTEAKLALAREVIVLMGAEGSMSEMMNVMSPTMVEQLVASGKSREFADRFVALFVEEFANQAPRVIDLAAIAYASAFSEAELTEIRAFYASPTGRVLVERTNELTAAMTRAGMIIGEDVSQQVLARMEAERATQQHQP